MAENAEIKARIASVADTKKITDAMYMISSVKLKKAQREVENTAPYFRALREQVSELFKHMPKTDNKYFKAFEKDAEHDHKHGLLLVTSDKGLAGSYNQTILSKCEEWLKIHKQIKLFVVGEYGRQYLTAKNIPFEKHFCYSADFPTVWRARMICEDLLEQFNDGLLDEIDIIYTTHTGNSVGTCKQRVLLPLEHIGIAHNDNDAQYGETEYYPSLDAVLSGVVPSLLTGYIYGALVDSFCSEQQARMTAMSSASRNAEEMLKELTLKYNRLRQASITREITEITAGARALKRKN